jgi:acyl-CoA synthetase (NDP forming)
VTELRPQRTLPIAALLRPRAIALVGVSPRGGVGAKILETSQRSSFRCPIWLVNANYAEINGTQCYASLASLPERPDCVVVSVPADAVLGVLAEAAGLGIPSVIVIAEGFADAGTEEGRERQRRLAEFARSAGMAIVGPNCMGIACLGQNFAATMMDIPRAATAGGISVVSQSGGLLNAIAELSANRGIGLNYLISSGNEAALDMADYIAFLADDPATRVICAIMEGTRDGRRFRAAVEQAAREKPLVVLKLGRSSAGQRATLAHTGTLAGRHEAFLALFRQNGIAAVDSLDALVETAALFDLAPSPRGEGVAMMTVSGGGTSLIADLGAAAGLTFPPLSATTSARLQAILGVERPFGNPIDTVGLPRLRNAGNIGAVIATLLEDDAIDVIALVLVMRADGSAAHNELVDAMAEAAKSAGARKPLMILSFMANSLTRHWRNFSRERGLPLVEDLELGVKAIRHLVDYAAFRRAKGRSSTCAPTAVATPARPAQLEPPARKILTEIESKKILAAAGLPVTREALARDPAEAVRIAAKIGGAVALKIQSPDIPHKSDIGGVRLGARTAAEVEAAARQVLDNAARNAPDAAIDGLLVQEMIEPGVEFVLGMTYDDEFGPLIVCGAGGVTVEVFKDSAVLLPPFAAEDVRAALRGLKASRLLDGFRGAPARDVEALVECCVKFSDFVVATDGQFAAIDLNPVIVGPVGHGVRIADALIERRRGDQT